MNDDKFYWLARLATADLDDPGQAAEELAPILKELAPTRGLSAGQLWGEMKKELLEKYGDESEWWKIDV
jgi:hypothetical protein